MTGGQAAPTTLLGQTTTTTPKGRRAATEGYPLHICELLATLEAPVYIERVGLGDNKQIAQAFRAIRRAVDNQVRGLGFSLIEVLSPCPTIWKMTPVDAKHWVCDVMERAFPLGVFQDRTRVADPRLFVEAKPALDKLPRILGVDLESLPQGHLPKSGRVLEDLDLRVRVAGFGGQGVLLLGEVLAEAGLDAGLEVSWLPSYGPEIRSGTSNCHVRIANQPIDSPLVTQPNVLVAMNEPSLKKFQASVRPGGWILYNGESFPKECTRKDVRLFARPFTQLADGLGDVRAGNMLMLGALLEMTSVLPEASIGAALRRLVKNSKWVELDTRALALGRTVYKESLAETGLAR
jgi:2-oxoisovalerate ferredoxin oxidoreductase beta subunit